MACRAGIWSLITARARRARSHIRVVRTAAPLRGGPDDVLGGVLDIAGFAVDAVLGVYLEARIGSGLIIQHFVDPGGAIEPRRLSVERQIDADWRRRVLEDQVSGLVFLMIGGRQKDAGQVVETQDPVRLRVDN